MSTWAWIVICWISIAAGFGLGWALGTSFANKRIADMLDNTLDALKRVKS